MQRADAGAARKPAISIAMATYNGARFLREQLDTLAAQTVPPLELVVTDDGSTDATRAIVEDFARSSPFEVRLVANESRLGWRRNFHLAAGLCRGDVIAFCDQDDIWDARKLAVVEREFARPGTLLVFHNADLMDEDGTRRGKLYRDSYPHVMPRLTWQPTWSNPLGFTIAFRQELRAYQRFVADSVDKASGGTPAAHDQWYFILAGALGDITFVDEALAGYRQHGNNALGWGDWDGRSGSLQRVRSEIASLRINAQALSYYADFLADSQDPPVALSQLASQFRDRAALYTSPRIADRWGTWARLVRERAYSSGGNWSFGRKAALVDGTLGIVLGPRILRGAE